MTTMDYSFDNGYFEQRMRVRYSTLFLLIVVTSLAYYIPYRNDIHIGHLFGLSLWFYFGLLNALLLTLVYLIIRGEIIIDFNVDKFIIREPKNNKEWLFSELFGIYLLSYDKAYLIRIRTKKLVAYDLKVDFEAAYKLIALFEERGFHFIHVRKDSLSKVTVPIPILLSKYEKRKSPDFHPEFTTFRRGPTLRAKLISIGFAPMLYVIAATLILRIPYLLRDLTLTKKFVSFIYWATAALLVDSGLYLLFGLSVVAYIATRIAKFFIHSSSSAK
ncbi:MAG: hypothetical protein K9W45_07160 [Candidatus Heimdallarchaeum aukensis]|uniref:Uncharacterized protein n=1 Tax=Candidatus Heimdallarchaeum aukensis TaxID=2876573 RepID=A0A9Y1FIN4_9ARCH|nr:MAG: hypothetical protein K9W45_07160 [Candidatus Heimdallarchaeum aukensis]